MPIIETMASNRGPGGTSSDRDLLRAVVDVLVLGEPFVLSLWQSSGLTLTQIRVLRAIQRTCTSAGALAQDAGIPPSSLSRILERLEERGLVVREVDRDDRRRVRIAVTAAGTSFLNALPALDRSPLGQAVADLDREERAALVRGVAALMAASRRRMPVARSPEADGPEEVAARAAKGPRT